MVVCIGGDICVEMNTHTLARYSCPGFFHQREVTKSDHSQLMCQEFQDSLLACPGPTCHRLGDRNPF